MPVYVGVDFHVKTQTLCWLDTTDGEIHQHTLDHQREDVAAFYRQWATSVTVGVEASGYAQWFHHWVELAGHRLLVGDAHAIRQFARRRQKNDRRDAQLLLDLLIHGDFPAVHVPPPASRVGLDLLHHRQRLVRMRTLLKNSLPAVALNHRLARGPSLFTSRGRTAFDALPLRRAEDWQRRDGFELVDELNRRIAVLNQELDRQVLADPRVERLRTHPGVGRLTALAMVPTLEPAARFSHRRPVAAYCGWDPQERSRGETVRTGGITKQGNRRLRTLLVEAAGSAIRPGQDAAWRQFYFHRLAHQPAGVAIVAVARKLALRLYRRLREGIEYDEFRRRGRDARCARGRTETVPV